MSSTQSLNPEEYQAVINGFPVKVSEMTVEQLQQELCRCMDLITDSEQRLYEVLLPITNWAGGR
jgi:hypothetical protein